MGLQASKPRNYDKSSKYAAKVKEESSDEEEGRSGLGKAKKRKHNGASGNSAHADTSKESVDTTMTDVKIKEELGRRAAKDPENTEKVLTWNMKTALASTAPPEEGQGSLLTSIEQDFIEAPEPEDSLSQDHMLRISVRDMFKLQNPEQSQKQLKLVYYKEDPTDNARDGGEMVGDDDSLKSEEEDIAKDMEATKQESPPVPPRSVRRLKRSRSRNESSCFPESGVSKVTKDEGLTVRGEMNAAAGITKSKPESKKRKMNHDDEQIKEEEGIKLEASEHADAEALAKERQLARQRAREALGSGTSSSKPKPKSKKHAKKLEKKQEGKPTKKLKMKDMMMNASNE